jgi:nucleoside-diphosphate-sugar epimerase
MPADCRILISGAASGLGKFLHRTLGGDSWTRNLSAQEREAKRRDGTDIIIHCANNSTHDIDSENLYSYLTDNVLLTRELAAIPHCKFVFISTVDVYPKDSEGHLEGEKLKLESPVDLYAVTKLMSESIVQAECSSPLILRCAALLGSDARPNSLSRMLHNDFCQLTLSAESEFNYILHRDVGVLIGDAIANNISGVYNVASSGNVRLGQIAAQYHRRVEFGRHHYFAGNVSNKKITAVHPAFYKTSAEVVDEFVSQVLTKKIYE